MKIHIQQIERKEATINDLGAGECFFLKGSVWMITAKKEFNYYTLCVCLETGEVTSCLSNSKVQVVEQITPAEFKR